MANKIEGQIWIDKNAPYSLKYHTQGNDYIVQVAQSYAPASGLTIPLASVVKFGSNGNIELAEFPKDAENVIGLTFSKASDASPTIAVAKSGYVILEGTDLTSAFISGDLATSFNNFTAATAIGAPVYWFIGRTSGSSYTHMDSHDNKGKLTFATPSGMKNVTTVTDNSLNVGYDNLPQVGTIASCTIASGAITKLEIHVNISAFDTSLEWSWPYIHTADRATCGYIAGTTTREGASVSIRHGLFCDNYTGTTTTSKSKQISTIEIKAASSNSDDYNIDVDANTTNTTTGTTGRRTLVQVNTPESLYYKVTGTIHYKLDKNHIS